MELVPEVDLETGSVDLARADERAGPGLPAFVRRELYRCLDWRMAETGLQRMDRSPPLTREGHQPIPVVGATALPFMCWSPYAIYRRSLASRACAELGSAEVTAAS